MRWVRDITGRFPKRPHYDDAELEGACEDLLRELQRLRPSEAEAPITSDDLAVLIERHADDLDLYADLAIQGADVEAVTEFAPGRRPRVRISQRLSEQPGREHRLRTTLAHELAHVVLHDFIWWFDQGGLDPERAAALSPRCHGRRPTGAVDWMEWQAAYASGALLMPLDRLKERLGEPRSGAAAWLRSSRGRALVRDVQRRFDVSAAAASVRLEQLGYVSARPAAVARAPLPRWSERRR